jgi:hypothetical protein
LTVPALQFKDFAMTAKEYARSAFIKIIDLIEPDAVVPLVDFSCMTDYWRAGPDDEDTVDFIEYKRRIAEVGELVFIEAHAKPVFVQIDPDEYFQWLERRENTAAARASFVGWIAAGRPENYSSIGGKTEL